MSAVLNELLNADKMICSYISQNKLIGRQMTSSSIIQLLRHFVERISMYEYECDKNIELNVNWETIHKIGEKYFKERGNLKFLDTFYNCLQISVSHYIPSFDESERLMLKYYEYLYKIKKYLKEKRNLDILSNLSDFPLYLDFDLNEYYEKIANILEEQQILKQKIDRYYILKKKPFFINSKIYYEITLTSADDISTKFDRIIAFTKYDIPQNYAVKLSLVEKTIVEYDMKVPIFVIIDWKTAIRPCEFNNFGRLFNVSLNVQTANQEYQGIMEFLTYSGYNLVDLFKLEDSLYLSFKNQIIKNSKVHRFIDLLDILRKNDYGVKNIILYLLYSMNNKIIKKQYDYKYSISDEVSISKGCLPFNDMPFVSSLKGHNPRFWDVFNSIGIYDHDYELLARQVKNNTEMNGSLYTSISNFEQLDLEELIKKYNNKIYVFHDNRKLCLDNKQLYIKGYEEDTLFIIKKLIQLSQNGIPGYSTYINTWLDTTSYVIDDFNKKEIVTNIFSHSKVGVIYGSAGTGKTTILSHISNAFNSNDKVYLANTNPAVDNLKMKVKTSNARYMTIHSYLNSNDNKSCDILFIDECSTVSNKDMVEILKTSNFKAIILVGDIYQIESITFGNWFYLIEKFISTSVHVLKNPYRTTNEKLLNLWDAVRNINPDIEEKLYKGQFSSNICSSFFEKKEKDETILCLNYDGLYGINNINKLLQINNKNKAYTFKDFIYKVGDPILFTENDIYYPVLYNNLKGIIENILEEDKSIVFDIRIPVIITEFQITTQPIQILSFDENSSTIRIKINKYLGTSDYEDRGKDTVVPFQIAYAVSIHKAQGLEYDSVKIIITNEVEEYITHNIFYTAITRARKSLCIYWSPETQKRVIEGMKKIDISVDSNIISNKYSLPLVRNK